jgi:hypothetical protein
METLVDQAAAVVAAKAGLVRAALGLPTKDSLAEMLERFRMEVVEVVERGKQVKRLLLFLMAGTEEMGLHPRLLVHP